MEYRFEDLSIKIDGKKVGSFTGTAGLAADRGGFRVASICIEDPEIKWLFRNGETTLERELRVAIEAEIYASPHARDAWAAHVEEERENAA